MPRRNITFSDLQMDAIKSYADAHNMNFSEVVRTALGLMIDNFDSNEVQVGGYRVISGIHWEYKTIISNDSAELKFNNIHMLDEGWVLAEKHKLDQQSGNVTSIYRRRTDSRET